MSEPLHLLVYGALDSGVTDSLRIGCFVEPLAKLGVEVRSWQSFADDVVSGGDAAPAASSGDALRDLGMTALAWADVVLFRRWHPTHIVCTSCDSAFASLAELADHMRDTGHVSIGPPDLVLRPIVELLTGHPELLGGRGIVYDTDDDVLDYPAWTGLGPAAARERDLVLSILAIADVVTASTPVLADRLRPHVRGEVRVIRNAVDPAWYSGGREAGLTGEVRVVYHGVARRLRDYAVARAGVDRVARSVTGLRRVWLGAVEPQVAACMDEVRPWADGLAAFGAALAAARPDVGLAPLLDEPFNRAKSELHWIEYAMVGAPAIATGFRGPGPFDVIRDGEDGLLARTPDDWAHQLRRLVTSPALRSELAARAGVRVRAEYGLTTRAIEWADTYRWAAAHGGYGRVKARPAAAATEARSR